jgi:hypothetical protein
MKGIKKTTYNKIARKKEIERKYAIKEIQTKKGK